MTRPPSKRWYLLAAFVMVCPVAWAGFDLGGQVRATLEAIESLPADEAVVVVFEAGETRTLFYPVSSGGAGSGDGCVVDLLDGQPPLIADAVDSHVEVTLFDRKWIASERLLAVQTGRVMITCAGSDGALGPDVGTNGLGLVTTFAGWTARFALWVVPGLVVGTAIALFVAFRRRQSMN